jgi:hypothetical protein
VATSQLSCYASSLSAGPWTVDPCISAPPPDFGPDAGVAIATCVVILIMTLFYAFKAFLRLRMPCAGYPYAYLPERADADPSDFWGASKAGNAPWAVEWLIRDCLWRAWMTFRYSPVARRNWDPVLGDAEDRADPEAGAGAGAGAADRGAEVEAAGAADGSGVTLLDRIFEGRKRRRYRITSAVPVSEGRFGKLYQATGLGQTLDCLLKLYRRSKDDVVVVETEKHYLNSAAMSNSPYLISYLDDFYSERTGYYIAMVPLCPSTLSSRLAHCLRSPGDAAAAIGYPTIVRYLHEICQGLIALHRLRVMHGSLSLTTALLTPGDRVRLSEFGLCENEAMQRRLARSSSSSVAPELKAGRARHFTADMDAWSLGVVAYKLACKTLRAPKPCLNGPGRAREPGR